MKKLTALVLAMALCLSLAGCSSSGSASSGKDDGYYVGIVQLVTHPALDAATEGFKDVLKEDLGMTDDDFHFQQADNSADVCTTIVNQFINEDVDLIMANATPALLAAANATTKIPILGTSVTDYGSALGLDNFSGTVGTNVSGTSDQVPFTQQAAMFDELLPDAQTIGMLYCSAESNSKFQVDQVTEYLEKEGKTVVSMPFTDSNDVATVTQNLCQQVDAIYIPTDNTAANCAETIGNIVLNEKTPVIAGEEGICKQCGIATLSIDYYDLGRLTGKMAVKILKGESKVSEMPIEYDSAPVKMYNASFCEAMGITIPDGYTKIEE